ncbi:MAG: hypothetical protein EBV06_15365 [Planctomycetia bacterium]|nr:hypothetical protein [Planctomycetia bacterium]
MTKFVRGLALIAGLSLVGFNAVRADEESKKAQKDILEIAADIEAGKDIAAKVAAVKKKYEDLNSLMHAYKPSEKGGIGFGPKAKGDGIEIKLNSLAKRALTKTAIDKEKADLVKTGYINIAIAKITDAYAPTKPKGGKTPKDWKKFTEDMEKASKSLIDAAKAGDSAALKTAATNLNSSCNNCHSDFRDS